MRHVETQWVLMPRYKTNCDSCGGNGQVLLLQHDMIMCAACCERTQDVLDYEECDEADDPDP